MVIGNFHNIYGLILISINYTLLTSESRHIKEHVKMSHSAQILEQYVKTIKINSRYKKKLIQNKFILQLFCNVS